MSATTFSPELMVGSPNESPIYVALLVVGFIFSFLLAFGVGANDVANSFGTSVGSGALTLRQACILATIFESLGAILIGYRVSDTVRKGIFAASHLNDEPAPLMMIFVAALVGSTVWLVVATLFSLPVSGSHSIVGAVLGAVLIHDISLVKWYKVGEIVASWFISPVLSGIISTGLYFMIKKAMLDRRDPLKEGLRSLPIIYAIAVSINAMSIIYNGPEFLGLDRVPFYGACLLTTIVGIVVACGVRFVLVPRTCGTIIKARNNTVSNAEANVDGDDAEDSIEAVHLMTKLQVLVACFGGFAHGGNDVSNSVSPLIALWMVHDQCSMPARAETPWQLLLFGAAGISIGLWVLGQRVIKTVGKSLSKITPSSGFAIELGAATTVLFASNASLPISTTHCKIGSVVMVGCFRSVKNVSWKMFGSILGAWFITLPATGAVSALTMFAMRRLISQDHQHGQCYTAAGATPQLPQNYTVTLSQ